MPQVPAGSDYGGQDGHLASHRWLGANTAIPTYFHYDEQLDKVKEFLKGAVSVDIFGFRKVGLRNAKIIALNDGQQFQLAPGETITFEVVIHNNRIGHSFVPEQRDFYEAWCEFEVSDGSGRNLFHSGYLGPDGRLESNAHTYETYLISNEGKLLDKHQVWEARIRAYDNTILPGHADVVRYRLSIPADAKGPLTAIAKVNYRRFRQAFSDWVLGTATPFPIVVVAEHKVAIALGINSTSGVDASSEFKRWNNYGIALLDQQEYDRAADAFERTRELSSDSVDALTNLAIVAMFEGRYEDAQKWIAKALAKQPKDERALAYRGLVYRLQYKLDAAITDLKHTVESFPRLSNAHQELGYAYFLKGDLQNARLHYEALQQIDPDSLEAHRYLSSIYGKLKLSSLASREAVAYAEQLNDPASAYLARSYWISHASVAMESVRSHVHGDETPLSMHKSLNDLLKTSLIWPSN
jgi:tetratricopeptide (TPR) repeat protein